jgi:hypothetical protein
MLQEMLILAGMLCLTTTSSLVQQVKISNDGVRKHNLGGLVVVGRCGWKRYWRKYEYNWNTDTGNVF